MHRYSYDKKIYNKYTNLSSTEIYCKIILVSERNQIIIYNQRRRFGFN